MTTARRVLVVHCHPDPESLVSAAKDRAVGALRDAGHDAIVVDLYDEGFDPLLDLDEWRAHGLEHEPAGPVAEYAGYLRWAETVVFTYPTWFGGQPAMLKGWLDRVCTNGVAYRLPPGKAHIRGMLRNIRRVVVITSHGSAKWVNGLEGEPGKRVLRRGFRSLCHPRARTRWVALYGVDRAPERARRAWLDRVARGGTVSPLLLRDARLADGRRVDVSIDGETIAAVTAAGTAGAGAGAAAGTVVVDVGGRLLVPAFAEPHAHLDKALSAERVPNPSGDLVGAIEAWHTYGPRLTVADMAERAERCARMLVANGVTAIRTHADVHDAVELRAVEALLDVRDRLAGTVAIEITALVGCPSTGREGEAQRGRLREAVAMGIDHVGGCPYLEADPAEFVDFALDIAGEAGLGLDLHMDETCDAGVLTLDLLAARVAATGFGPPVLAGHCVSLGMQPHDVQARVAAAVAGAGVSVVALPQTNLYLQGRGALVPPRGLTAIAALRAAGANVAAGGDNVQDPFNPVGRADPLETAALLVMAGHLLPDDAFDAVTARARAAMGLAPVTVAAGSPAELVALPAASVREAIAVGPGGRLVVHRGRVVAGA